jgi:GNAT superfamily N-acetyltransferase
VAPEPAPVWRIDAVDDQARADALQAELETRIIEFNCDATGYRDGRKLSFEVRDDAGALVAGLDGFTWGGYARVEWLWVQDTRRECGLGAALIAAAQAEARARGCETIILETHEFQAPGFYERLGFERVGTTQATPRGWRQFSYQKSVSGDD